MQKIIIKAVDAKGETVEYIKMSAPVMAEMVFYGLTHDPESAGDLNWDLLVDGESIMWHHPGRDVSEKI